MNVCSKCGREITEVLESNKRWIKVDKLTQKQHSVVCHPGPLKFKEGDKVIMFWPKSQQHYRVVEVNHIECKYLMETFNAIVTSHVLWNVAKTNGKLMDKIYELLYL